MKIHVYETSGSIRTLDFEILIDYYSYKTGIKSIMKMYLIRNIDLTFMSTSTDWANWFNLTNLHIKDPNRLENINYKTIFK